MEEPAKYFRACEEGIKEKFMFLISWITERSVCFLQKCAWNVLVFKKNHVKIKQCRAYLFVFSVIWLKFLIANWDALIPFFLVSSFYLKSKIFFLFVLGAGPFLATKSAGPGAVASWSPVAVFSFFVLYLFSFVDAG